MMPPSTVPGELPCFSNDPRDADFFNDPYPFYDEVRAAGPFVVWQDYALVCATRHDEVSRLLRDRRLGRRLKPVSDSAAARSPFQAFERYSLLELEPPAHTRLRQLVNRAFVSSQGERLRAPLTALAHRCLDELAAGDDLLRAYAEPIPVQTIATLLGVPASMGRQLLDWSHAMVAMYEYRRDSTTLASADAATRAFSDYLKDLIRERRRVPRDDLLSRLIAARDRSSALSTDEIVSTAILLLNAGHEATVHAIGNGVKALLEAGVAPQPLFATPERAARAVDELIRFDSPLHLFTRVALGDVDVAGLSLGRGDEIGLLLACANRDPRRYDHPDRLDFERGGHGQLGFGAGIHFCVGAPLARLEVEVALAVLFERFPRLRFAEPPEYADRFHFHGLTALRVEP